MVTCDAHVKSAITHPELYSHPWLIDAVGLLSTLQIKDERLDKYHGAAFQEPSSVVSSEMRPVKAANSAEYLLWYMKTPKYQHKLETKDRCHCSLSFEIISGPLSWTLDIT